jgi:hypothetical protein
MQRLWMLVTVLAAAASVRHGARASTPTRLFRASAPPAGAWEMTLGANRLAQFRPRDPLGWHIRIYERGNARAPARLVKQFSFPPGTPHSQRFEFFYQWAASPDGKWLLGATSYWPAESWWVLIDTRTGVSKLKLRPRVERTARAKQCWTSAKSFLEVRTDQPDGIQIGEYRVPDLKRIGAWTVPSDSHWYFLAGMRGRELLLTTRVLDQHRMVLKSIPLPHSDGGTPVVVPETSLKAHWVDLTDRMVFDVKSSPDGKWIAWSTVETKPGSDEYVSLEKRAPGKRRRSGAIGRIEVTDAKGGAARTVFRAWKPLLTSEPNIPIGDVSWFASGDRLSFWLYDGYYSIPFQN